MCCYKLHEVIREITLRIRIKSFGRNQKAQLSPSVGKMKAVVVLAGLVALTLAGTVPEFHHVETKSVDADFVLKQKKVLHLVENAYQVDPEADYYKIGFEYDIQANIDNYTNKKAVEEFLTLYKTGFLPKYHVFSVYYDRLREEAIALFHLFYYAKDFETFYKTAAFARVYLNEGQFLYAYYIAVMHRADTKGFVLPAPYETYPQFFANYDVFKKMYSTKMQEGIFFPETSTQFGVVKENDYYVFYSNYSTSLSYSFGEEKLSYFTEDIGLNAYYYYFHSYFPFWLDGEFFGAYKERRGEGFYFFYKQLLARYYLERLTNGLGEIPKFSWYYPIKYGYYTFLSTYYPFIQRSDYYQLYNEENFEYLQYLDTYEKTFLQYLEQGHFKAYNQEIDLHNSKAINFVGNYWQGNADLYKKTGYRHYEQNYGLISRHLLSAAPKPFDKYTVAPGALEFYQTSLRDPIFYQYYGKVLSYILKYKEYLAPYSQEYLHYVGVKINDVKVDKLVTFFDFFDFDATNAIFHTAQELKTKTEQYKIRQPRLNHKTFNVEVDVKSDIAGEAVVKFFLGPKYDSNGYPIKLEDNWMNFIELDWFKYTLKPGQNKIVRSSKDFYFYKEDSVSTYDIFKFLDQGKVPTDMSEEFYKMPYRLMLPKGTYGGFPFQFFVVVYPYESVSAEFEHYGVDNKPYSYPLDRPINEAYFFQPNMFFEDVEIYHEGEAFPYQYNTPYYFTHHNQVPKH